LKSPRDMPGYDRQRTAAGGHRRGAPALGAYFANASKSA